MFSASLASESYDCRDVMNDGDKPRPVQNYARALKVFYDAIIGTTLNGVKSCINLTHLTMVTNYSCSGQ